ncbi:MAG: HlyD family secretion protein [Acidobacteriia bacterium]|nr:HlyD family secretion protein [Terriglobia bacterium]
MNFTDAEREAAQLPKPPDEDSEVSTILRPGLLADVEIQVEKIPSALHVPNQAVMRKDGKPTVFVKLANGKFQAREVQLGKASESVMVITAGLKEGEEVALSDPTANKNKQQNTEEKKSSSSPSGMLPGAK